MLWTKQNTKNQNTSRQIGQLTEELAADYLTSQGLTLQKKNVHCRQGEIDLIMLDGDIYVFVEVKYRKNSQFGGAISAIPTSKQKKIKHAITFYLQQVGLNEYNTACRIDVVALEGDINQPKVTWIKNAF